MWTAKTRISTWLLMAVFLVLLSGGTVLADGSGRVVPGETIPGNDGQIPTELLVDADGDGVPLPYDCNETIAGGIGASIFPAHLRCLDGSNPGVFCVLDSECLDGGTCSVNVAAPAEVCNALDDDCDSQADEDFPELGDACVVGMGECANNGVFQCPAGGTEPYTECSVTPFAPVPETGAACGNGLDDNCDGTVDNPLRYVDDALGDDTANDCTASGSPCKTIQHAVDQACDAGTINAAAGTYGESVLIAKPITLACAQAGTTALTGRPAVGFETIIDGSGFTNAIDLRVGGVRIDGCEITGDTTTTFAGIQMFNDSADIDDVTIVNNVIHHIQAINPFAGFQQARAFGVFGVMGAPGSRDERLREVTVQQNYIYEIGHPTTPVGGSGVYLNNVEGPTFGAQIDNNLFEDMHDGTAVNQRGSGVAIDAKDDAFAPSSGVTIEDNTYARMFSGVGVYATGSTVTEAHASFTDVACYVLNAGDSTVLGVPLAVVDETALRPYARTDRPTGLNALPESVAYYERIGTAIAESDPTAVPFPNVDVTNGLFIESNIAADRPVVVRGESQAGVIVAPEGEDANTDDTFTPPFYHGFLIQASDVTIRDLTIDGWANPTLTFEKNNFRMAILTDFRLPGIFDGLSVENVAMRHIYRRGLQLYSAGGKSTGHVITGSSVHDVTVRQCLMSFNSDVVMTSNVLTECPQGIGTNYLGGAANAPLVTLQSNNISSELGGNLSGLADGSLIGGPTPAEGNTWDTTGPGDGLGAIIQWAAGQVTVQNNNFLGAGNDAGLWVYRNAVPANTTLVRDNVFQSTASTRTADGDGVGILATDDGILVGDGTDGATYAELTGNTITGFLYGIELFRDGAAPTGTKLVDMVIGGPSAADANTLNGVPGGTGIRIFEVDGSTGGYTGTARIENNRTTVDGYLVGIDVDGGDATIEKNLIQNNGTGILVQNDGTATATGNSIKNNTTAGLDNTTVPSVSALCNFWNDPLGPNTGGDVTAGTVDISTWLEAEDYNEDLDFDTYTSCTDSGDCNILNAAINPGALEVCGDSFDNDCDGFTDGGPRYVEVGGSDLSNDCTAPGLSACATIQHAIDEACVDDTVNVGAGTFAEDVSVNKRVTVLGQGVGSTIVDVSGQGGQNNSGVWVSAAGVTLSQFAVSGNNLNPPRYGIKVSHPGFARLDGVTLDNLLVENLYRTGFDLNGPSNLVMTNCESRNNNGAGVFLLDADGAAISGLTTSGNSWTGISVATYGRYAPLGTTGVVFSGTNSFAEVGVDNGGLQLEEGNYNAPASPEPISWSSCPADGADVTILPADFLYVLGGPQDDVNPRLRFYKTQGQAQSAAAGSPDHFLANDRYIQDADCFGTTPTNFHVFDDAGDKMSIQAAIDEAVADDVVNVADGGFAGGLNIDKSLTLSCNNAGTPYNGLRVAESVIDGSGIREVITTGSSNVTVDGCELLGDAGTTAGFHMFNSSAPITGNSVVNNLIHGMGRDNEFSVFDVAYGVFGVTGTGPGARQTISELTVTGNSIFDIGTFGSVSGGGIYLFNVTSPTIGQGVTISGNFLHEMESGSATLPDIEAGTGIVILEGSDDGGGLPVTPATGVLVTGNTYDNVVIGAVLMADTSSFSEARASFSNTLGPPLYPFTGFVLNLGIDTFGAGPFAAIDEPALVPYATTNLLPGFTDDHLLYTPTITAAVASSASGADVNATAGTFGETILFDTGFAADGLTVSGTAGIGPNACAGGGTVITNGVMFRQTADIVGIELRDLELTGVSQLPLPGGGIIDMDNSGSVADMSLVNVCLDGQFKSHLDTGFTHLTKPPHGLLGQNLRDTFTVTGSEFRNILGWSVLDTNSGSGGDGDLPFTNIVFTDNAVHENNGSMAFRGFSGGRTTSVLVSGNTWNNIGNQASPSTVESWAALEVNRTELLTMFNNSISNVVKSYGGAGEGQALQIWDIDTVDIHDNTLVSNEQGGIKVYTSAFGSDFDVPGGSIYNNDISGNGDFGIEALTSPAVIGPLDANCNWWGAVDGASPPAGAGTGDVANALGVLDVSGFLLLNNFGVDPDGDLYNSCTAAGPLPGAPPTWNLVAGGDCAPLDPASNPGASEVCDGDDNNCDTVIPVDETLVDADSYVACMPWNDTQLNDPLVTDGNDCDETRADVNPGVVERCDDTLVLGSQVDRDCDGLVETPNVESDPDCASANTCQTDSCGTNDACTFIASGNCGIAGNVVYNMAPGGVDDFDASKPVENAVLDVTGDTIATENSDNNGDYVFLSVAGDLTLDAKKLTDVAATDYLAALTGQDSSKIAQFSVGIATLSPRQFIAGDVSNNGLVTSFDAALVAQKVVNPTTFTFPVATANGSDWAFFDLPQNYTPIAVDTLGVDLAGVVYGDVTLSWTPTAKSALEVDGEPKPAGDKAGGPSVDISPRQNPALVYLAAIRPLRDGTVEYVLGLAEADGILSIDVKLGYPNRAVTLVGTQAGDLLEGFQTISHDQGDGHAAAAMYGVQPLAGTGEFLSVILRIDGPVRAFPLELQIEANEGLIPVALSPELTMPERPRPEPGNDNDGGVQDIEFTGNLPVSE